MGCPFKAWAVDLSSCIIVFFLMNIAFLGMPIYVYCFVSVVCLHKYFYLSSEQIYLFSPTFYSCQLILVGICCCGRGDGTDPYEEVSLQLLPEYTIPSDGVTMTCITCTDKGRIFLAGRDGNIYEMYYTTGSGWSKRCRKVCLTVGLGSVISRYYLNLCFLSYFKCLIYICKWL